MLKYTLGTCKGTDALTFCFDWGKVIYKKLLLFKNIGGCNGNFICRTITVWRFGKSAAA